MVPHQTGPTQREGEPGPASEASREAANLFESMIVFTCTTLLELILPTLSVEYFDQLLGAVLFIHFISNHDTT